MPSSFAALDTGFPSLEGMGTEQRIQTLVSYLYSLLENLRYVLNNLGEENINETEWKKITNQVVFTALGQDGATIINGGNISTGTIDASQVNVDNIDAHNIKVGELDGVNIRGVKIYGVDVYGSQYHGGAGNSALFYVDAGLTGAVMKFKNSDTDTELFSVSQEAYGDSQSADLYLLNKMVLSTGTRDSEVFATGNWEFVLPASFPAGISLPAGSDYPTQTEVQAMIAAALSDYYTKTEADARFEPITP